MLIFGIIILVSVTLAIIAAPFFLRARDSEEGANLDFTLAELEQEKETAYLGIKEAEFERATGKLSDEDFKSLKESYSAKAVETMKKIEEYQNKETGNNKEVLEGKLAEKGTKKERQNFCERCGAQILKNAKFCSSCGTSLSKFKYRKSSFSKSKPEAKKANICFSCGAKYKKDDKFCASCGKRIT